MRLIDIQGSIISHKIWKDPELIDLLQICATGEEIPEESIDRCLKTVLVQTGVQINEINKALDLNDRMAEGVF